jgi:hypothetical protein
VPLAAEFSGNLLPNLPKGRYRVLVETSREERLAANESFFRDLNERISDEAVRHGVDGHEYEFICECADVSCIERVTLSIAEYERIRADGSRFVLALGHNVVGIETVVAANADHAVVEKVGVAGEVAEALDPRAA